MYEIAKYGKCKDRDSEILTGFVVAFAKYINSNLSFGFSLYENDTFNDTIPSRIKEKYANILFSDTNFRFWLDIAEGNYKEIEINYLELEINDISRYKEIDIHLLMHRISLIKLLCIYKRSKKGNRFDLFVEFFNWYIDNMIISNALIVYAALIFGNYCNIKLPKNCNSDNISKILKGIENQAWDINQITQWSTFIQKKIWINAFICSQQMIKL